MNMIASYGLRIFRSMSNCLYKIIADLDNGNLFFKFDKAIKNLSEVWNVISSTVRIPTLAQLGTNIKKRYRSGRNKFGSDVGYASM